MTKTNDLNLLPGDPDFIRTMAMMAPRIEAARAERIAQALEKIIDSAYTKLTQEQEQPAWTGIECEKCGLAFVSYDGTERQAYDNHVCKPGQKESNV